MPGARRPLFGLKTASTPEGRTSGFCWRNREGAAVRFTARFTEVLPGGQVTGLAGASGRTGQSTMDRTGLRRNGLCLAWVYLCQLRSSRRANRRTQPSTGQA